MVRTAGPMEFGLGMSYTVESTTTLATSTTTPSPPDPHHPTKFSSPNNNNNENILSLCDDSYDVVERTQSLIKTVENVYKASIKEDDDDRQRQSTISELENELKRLKQENQVLNRRILEDERRRIADASIKEELLNNKVIMDGIVTTQAEFKSLRNKYGKMVEDMKNRALQRDSLLADYASRIQEIKAKQEERKDLRKKNKSLHAEISTSKQSNLEVKNELRESCEKLNRIAESNASLSREVATLKGLEASRVKNLKDVRDEFLCTCETLRRDVLCSEDELSILASKLELKLGEIAALEAQAAHKYAEYECKLSSVDQEMSKRNVEMDNAKQELELTKKKFSEMTDIQDDLKKKARDKEDALRSELQAAVDGAHKQIAQLQESLDAEREDFKAKAVQMSLKTHTDQSNFKLQLEKAHANSKSMKEEVLNIGQELKMEKEANAKMAIQVKELQDSLAVCSKASNHHHYPCPPPTLSQLAIAGESAGSSADHYHPGRLAKQSGRCAISRVTVVPRPKNHSVDSSSSILRAARFPESGECADLSVGGNDDKGPSDASKPVVPLFRKCNRQSPTTVTKMSTNSSNARRERVSKSEGGVHVNETGQRNVKRSEDYPAHRKFSASRKMTQKPPANIKDIFDF